MIATAASRTILNDSGVLAEASHYFCCCQRDGAGPARRWIRIETLMFAVEQAVEIYGADPGSFADDYRRSRYWAKRCRKAVRDLAAGRITQDKYDSITQHRDNVAAAFGTIILDRLAFSGRTFACSLHPQNGSWAMPRIAC